MGECNDLKLRDTGFKSESDLCVMRLQSLFDEFTLQSIDIVVYSSNRPYRNGPNQAITIGLIERMKQQNSSLKVLTIGGYINTRIPCARLINETGTTAACARPENVSYFADQKTEKAS